jgi:hypothetical protein
MVVAGSGTTMRVGSALPLFAGICLAGQVRCITNILMSGICREQTSLERTIEGLKAGAFWFV